MTPYLCAGANGFHRILRGTIDAGADLRSVNRFGGTALLPSSEKGYLATVHVCLDAGVAVDHVNMLGWSALLEAVILGDGGRLYSDVIAALVSAGADLHLPDRDGHSALMHAQSLGQRRVLQTLAAPDNSPAATTGPALVRKSIRDGRYDVKSDALANIAGSDDVVDPLDRHYYRGFLLAEARRFDEALSEYRRALALDPAALEFYFYTANCLRSAKHSDEALREYDTAISLQPQAPFHRYHKSNYLRELNRHEQAVAEMDVLLVQQRGRYDFSFHKANSLRALGRHREAIAAIENAIAVDPDNGLYHAHKAQSLAFLS